ncbi:meiotic recombination protein W68 [Cataglyphis hispanica]|uniref:meiotic recombination protein W68 n=1 Tax=Cataglyphis hispanica TaxID=1086592 RepID=UPI0021802D91|nr:meiotic recombination protein W68 [Cataglyphis hispanica]
MDLIARIEAVTLKIIKQISVGQPPYVSYCNGSRNIATESSLRKENVCTTSLRANTMPNDCTFDFADEQDTRKETNLNNENLKKIIVNFAVKGSRNKFILMVMIMSEAHRLLLTNTTKMKRSFYYDLKNEITKSLTPHQRSIERALNSVANLLECAPWDLRLLATPKGLVAGNMTITLLDNRVVDCAILGGVQIPQIILNVTSIRVKANFVLVIEKDTIFQKLLEEDCPRILKCILVTGKGYPDMNTRMLVNILSVKIGLPVYIIVDANPFGVDIMLLYRFGSSKFCRQNESLACPNARWLGIHPSESVILGMRTNSLTKTDFVKLRSIESRTYVNDDISKELSILRKGKADIEALSSFTKNFLTATYLPYKIDGKKYI